MRAGTAKPPEDPIGMPNFCQMLTERVDRTFHRPGIRPASGDRLSPVSLCQCICRSRDVTYNRRNRREAVTQPQESGCHPHGVTSSAATRRWYWGAESGDGPCYRYILAFAADALGLGPRATDASDTISGRGGDHRRRVRDCASVLLSKPGGFRGFRRRSAASGRRAGGCHRAPRRCSSVP